MYSARITFIRCFKPVQSLFCGQSFRIFSANNISRERIKSLIEMKKLGPWTSNFFVLVAVILACEASAANKPGVKAVILYMYDDATIGSNVVSMEVDKNTFMNVIKDSQFQLKSAKPMKFGQDNGFFALLDGESSSFSFATATGIADCSCQCSKKVEATTTTTPRPITTPRPVTTTSQALRTTSTPAPTYLPPTSTRNPCPSGGSGPYCCPNGAANVDCCANGGKGQYCCLNGQNNPGCEAPRPPTTAPPKTTPATPRTTPATPKITLPPLRPTPPPTYLPPVSTPRPPTPGPSTYLPPVSVKEEIITPPPRQTPGPRPPKCANGALDSAYPDCCVNGGRGRYCCTNGSPNPGCELPTRPTGPTRPTVRPTSKFKGPTYLPLPTIKTTRAPYVPETYTYGSVPTYTYSYTWSHAPWSHDPKATTKLYTTTVAPKYAYDGPINAIQYNNEYDNSL